MLDTIVVMCHDSTTFTEGTTMTIQEAREMLDFMGSREDAVANDCAQDWDEAWEAAFPSEPIHLDLAGHSYTI